MEKSENFGSVKNKSEKLCEKKYRKCKNNPFVYIFLNN